MSKYIVHDEPTLKFLSNLGNLRRKAGLTLNAISEKLNISVRTYMNYEYLRSPSLSRLFMLSEFFDYDLSDSINHKRYYGGMLQSEKKRIRYDKLIYLDEPARRFFYALKSERKKIGLTLKEVGETLGFSYSTLSDDEDNRCYPKLRIFIMLAGLYKYDISESVNYKYFYNKINTIQFRDNLKRYGLRSKELAQLTGYSEETVKRTINFASSLSLGCLSEILKVIKQEQEAEQFRKKLLRTSRGIKAKVTQGHYPHRRRNYA